MRALARSSIVRLVVSLAILAYLASRLDMGEALGAIVRVDLGWLTGVLCLVAVDRTVMIWRWVLLLRAVNTPIALADAARIFLVSAFVGSFLPAGVGGDAARAYSLSRVTARRSDAVASVALDRLLGMVSIALMGALGAIVWASAGGGRFQRVLFVGGLLTVVGCAAVLWIDAFLERLLPSWLARTGPGGALLRLAGAVGRYRTRPGAVGAVLGLSLIVQILRIVQAYMLGLGLDLTVSFWYYLLFMPIGLLMLLLPISISGFGLPQGVMVWLLRPVGVSDTDAFALSALIVLTGLAGNLPGALLYVGARNK